jgi:predicted TIM-barrel fold metal-dependent hydrolase
MIDTHQHLMYPERFDYSWAKDLAPLNKAFPLKDYRQASDGTPITGSVFMEVDVDEGQAADEAGFFCGLADDPTNGILGVIAAGRPEREGLAKQLEAMMHTKLKGIRRVLHTQPDELSESSLFREQVGQLGRMDLSFDLCVKQSQLNKAIALVRACPETTFILDHCGVPDIAGNDAPNGAGWLDWQQSICRLAELPNINSKISGITVYASESQRNEAGLRPYIDVMLEAFGVERLVWGGDWPVVVLGSGLRRWCELSQSLLGSLSDDEQRAIFTDNAKRIYRL